MADANTSKRTELLDLTLSLRAERILQQITEEHGVAVGDVVELAICTGLPSAIKAITCAPDK